MHKPLPRAVFIAVLLFWLHFTPEFTYGYYQHTGMWVVRHQLTSKKKIDEVVKFAKDNGISDLFVQVIGRGRTYYYNDLLPESPNISNINFDPFDYICKQVGNSQIKVHAWLNILLVWSHPERPLEKEHFIIQYPNWFVVDNTNSSIASRSQLQLEQQGIEGKFLSPCIPEVRSLYKSVVKDLISRYNIHGIHLDYIRFPSDKFGYHSCSREKFQAMTGLDPLYIHRSDLVQKFADRELIIKRWNDFRCGFIDSVVGGIAKTVKARDDIQLSAAVKPDPDEARKKYFQDWAGWINMQLVDFVIVMNYTRNHNKFIRIAKKIRSKSYHNKVWMGIGTYNQNPIITDKQVNTCKKYTYNGIALFSYQSIVDKDLFVKKFGLD